MKAASCAEATAAMSAVPTRCSRSARAMRRSMHSRHTRLSIPCAAGRGRRLPILLLILLPILLATREQVAEHMQRPSMSNVSEASHTVNTPASPVARSFIFTAPRASEPYVPRSNS